MKLIVEIPSLSSPTGKVDVYEVKGKLYVVPHSLEFHYKEKLILIKGTLVSYCQRQRATFRRYLKMGRLSSTVESETNAEIAVLNEMIKKLKEAKDAKRD